MKFQTKYLICLWKSYFDKGFALTNYLKYPLVVLGFNFPNIEIIVLVAFLYAIFCFVFGYWWFKSGFIKAEIEVGNIYNLFVTEMRKKIGIPNKRKI